MEVVRVPQNKIESNTTSQWELIQRQCRAFIESGFLPNHIQNIAQAITIAWKGHELGIPPLAAFSGISVINGKPCLSAELMLSLVYSRLKGAKVTFITAPEKQHQECAVRMQRPGGDPMEFRFTIEDAQRAGIYKNAWLKYPQALLRARVISAGCRAVFPDCIMGCYTPEEMGGEAIIDEPEVISTVSVNEATETPPELKAAHKMPEIEAGSMPSINDAQVRKVMAVAKKFGWTEEDVNLYIFETLGLFSKKELTSLQMDNLLRYMEAFPRAKASG